MGKIIITVRAINWTDGNLGHVHVCLNGGSCQIDWGDGCTSCHTSVQETPEWIYHIHFYPSSCKATGERFNIIISSDSDNIVGIMADSGEMDVEDIDIRECQSLVYFEASYLIDHFDLTTNPGIREMDLSGEACKLADFSNSTELKKLYFCNTGIGTREKLDLTKCDKLEYLVCRYAHEVTHIAISNRSALKKLVYDEETPLNDTCIQTIKRIVERNGGEIVKVKK